MRETESGIEPWTEDTTTRERVREIAKTLTQPRSVNWVKEQAHVSSWETTKDELETLAEFGQIRKVEDDQGNVVYAPDYRRRYIDEVLKIMDEHTKDELRDEIAEIQERIDGWKEEYEVSSRGEIESSLSEVQDADEIHERNRILRKWESAEADKRLLNHALRLYDDAQEPDATVTA